MKKTVIQPAGWQPAKGYANGVIVHTAGEVRHVYLAGQIGWDGQQQFVSDDLVDQVRQTLLNVRTLLSEADAGPEHLVRMTWYLVDRVEYLARAREIGAAYREVMGRAYDIPMSAVQVAALIEARAKVEIEVTALVPARC